MEKILFTIPETLTHDLFLDRIFGLVKDYGLNLQEAILWDMMGFPELSMIFSEAVEEYITINNLEGGYASLYRDILLGKSQEIVIEDDEV
jgi:hypothetical protein